MSMNDSVLVKINIKLNDCIRPYSDLSHDKFSVFETELPFCYIHIDFNTIDINDVKKHIKEIISKLKDFLLMGLREKWEE